jgi:WD40 repeat protein
MTNWQQQPFRLATLIWAIGPIVVLIAPGPTNAGDEPPKPVQVAKVETGGSAGDIRFSPDGKTLAVLDSDPAQHFILWDVPTRKVRDTLKDVARVCMDFAFTPDSRGLALINISRVQVLDLKTRESRALYKNSDDADALAFSPDGKLLATGDTKGQVVVWDYAAGKERAVLKCPGLVGRRGIRFYPNGKTLVVSGSRSTMEGNVITPHDEIWLFDLDRKELRRTITEGTAALAVSPDGKTLATQGEWAKEVLLWDTATDKVREKYKLKEGHVFALEYSPDGRVLFAGGGQPENLFGIRSPGLVTAFDTVTGKPLGTFKALEDHVAHMAVSPDGKLLAVSYGLTTGSLKHIAVWDVSSLVPQSSRK